MHWLLTPYDKHSDDGFGAMASAFKASAETLMAADTNSITPRELPACFLLRHAAELFLKSVLIVSHRALAASDKPFPAIEVDGKDKQLTNVHNLGALYRAFATLLTRHEAELKLRTETAWLPTPPELDEAIAMIDDMDSRGVFFRYPTENNSSKSNNKPITIEEVERWHVEQEQPLKAMFVVDQNDELVAAFRHDLDLLKPELAALTTACYWLNCFHVGLRCELAGGW
ncbi:hypothetical protein [Paraburkholderia hospita]|uniref:hypothetical protein n=1 Tax=Paraburkholderia hospita TaxID=169430 RepID=UPI0008A7A4CE|nr:hypothetical protein [Paraburkholderia hospita]SEI14928.1 hypothetical protein SAMN05192544_1025141 [Paraburkholderia hospita]